MFVVGVQPLLHHSSNLAQNIRFTHRVCSSRWTTGDDWFRLFVVKSWDLDVKSLRLEAFKERFVAFRAGIRFRHLRNRRSVFLDVFVDFFALMFGLPAGFFV